MQPINVVSDPLERALGKIGRARGTEFGAGMFATEKVVVFGAGHLGKVITKAAQRAGLQVRAIADNNPVLWGRRIDGVPVLSPADAVAAHNEDAVFVVGVYNSAKPRKQLAELGCSRISPFPLFFWHYPEAFVAENGIALPEFILRSTDAMREGYALLDDDASRSEFAAQVEWRCTLNYDCLPAALPGEDTYDPRGLAKLGPDEVLVDCGAFDGDSIRMLLGKTGGSFRHIYAVEPDPSNRAKLGQFVNSLPGDGASRVTILPYGVGARNEVLSFNATGTAGSSFTSGSETQIECRRLDDIVTGPDPTFVKMDIEGAEPYAISGATGMIRRARPILAVCSYHSCEHMWTLPVLLKRALPEYKLFLRRYAEECWEMVYYAIPPERLIAS